MNGLEQWLTEATRGLARESAARVRGEVREHYEESVAAGVARGLTGEAAGNAALAELGEARMANCQYRQVLLTVAEARLLRDAQWEAAAVCGRVWLRWALLAVPVGALAASAMLWADEREYGARVALAIGLAFGVLVAGAVLPVNTVGRGRVFRAVKWGSLAAAMALAFGENLWANASLLIACAWPLVWVEMTRMGIRRKLRTTEWPRSLYL